MNEQPILHYDQQAHNFWFYADHSQMKSLYPFMWSRDRNGLRVVCSDRYPMSLLGIRTFKALYPHGTATPDALQHIQAIATVKEEIAVQSKLALLEHVFQTPPYTHQREAIEYMLHYPRLAFLLEQGLGKTYISIMGLVCLRALGIPHKALVVCPNIVFPSWLSEIAKFSNLRVLPYKGDPELRERQRQNILNQDWDIVLTTFDMLLDRKNTNSKSGLGRDLLKKIWQALDTKQQLLYATKWNELCLISSIERNTLTQHSDSSTWLTKCVGVVAKIPLGHLPLEQVQKLQQDYSNCAFFKQLPYNVLIVDEASRCLDPKSQRSQNVELLSLRAERVYLLSGTLCVGRPTDLFMPMQILAHDILASSWTNFKKTYCVSSPHNINIIIGYRNLDKLKLLVQPHVLSMSRDTCLDLPKRIFMQRYYKPTKTLVTLYNNIVEKSELTINNQRIIADNTLVKITKCLQILNGFIYAELNNEICNSCERLTTCVLDGIIAGSKHCLQYGKIKPEVHTILLKDNPKLKLLEEDLEDNRDEKMIIWAWYQQDLQSIAKLLQQKKIPFISAREENCAEKFERDSRIRVFLGQTAQGIGITLNSATCMIYYSHGAALEPRLQSMDRNYRIGQTKSVVVKDYIAKGTVEELLVTLLAHKTDVKNFMQDSIQCFCCELCTQCAEKGIPYLGQGCQFNADKKRAEQKKNLKLWTI